MIGERDSGLGVTLSARYNIVVWGDPPLNFEALFIRRVATIIFYLA